MAEFVSVAAKSHSHSLFPFVAKLKIGKLEGLVKYPG